MKEGLGSSWQFLHSNGCDKKKLLNFYFLKMINVIVVKLIQRYFIIAIILSNY